MAVALAVSGVVFAAFCVWLGVRVINRRERSQMWTLTVALIVGCSIGCQIVFNVYVEAVIADLHQGW
jgi:hypothetical protein